jgi:RNA polymerase sigma-70 factor (ECF subfamily)
MDAPLGTGHLTTEELFRQHAGFVARFLTRLGVPSEQRQDALQEVFLVVHRNGGYRPGIAKPTSYLANIAIRAAAQHRRRQGVARQRHSEAPVDQMPGEIEDPARALQVSQDLQRLQVALERLPEDLRTTLVLVELEGESCVSVAAGLGCPVGTIYWRLHQARKELQSALKAADAPRRSARPVPVPGGRVQPARSFMLLFGLDGFRRSDASRLLQLARDQPPPSLALDELFGRHQQLVRSGAELPTWAHGFTPHAASWLTLLGAGPIIAGAVTGAAMLAAVVLMSYRAPPAPDDAPREPIATMASEKPAPEGHSAEATSAEAAKAEAPSADAPSAARSAIASESASAKLARDRLPRAAQAQPRAQGAPASTASATSTSSEMTDVRAAGVRARAETAAAPAAPARAAAERPEDAVAKPAPELAPAQAVQKKSSTAPDLELAEMREIERAERLLSDDPQRALELTRSMQAGFPAGHFREERAYLEVMALKGLGRTREMREKAAAFLRGYPTGLYSSRVRKAAAGEAH